MNERVERRRERGSFFPRCDRLADYDSHQPQSNQTPTFLDRCPTSPRLSEQTQPCRLRPAHPATARLRNDSLAGKPEVLVIPRACVSASARTSYTGPSSEEAGPLTRRSGVFAHPAPHPTAHASWCLEAGRQDSFFFSLLGSLPCASHLPRTGPRPSLGSSGVCDWLAPRSLQLGEARRTAAERTGVGSLPATPREPAAASQRPGQLRRAASASGVRPPE